MDKDGGEEGKYGEHEIFPGPGVHRAFHSPRNTSHRGGKLLDGYQRSSKEF